MKSADQGRNMNFTRRTVAACCMCIAGSLQCAQAQSDPLPPTQVLSSHGNRFVFGQLSRIRADQFMLDTTAGRLWRLVCSKEDEAGKTCTVYALEPILYLGEKGYAAPVPQYQLPAPK